MLVENKFIFLSLPRCASTSFQIACLKSGFDLKFATEGWEKIVYSDYEKIKDLNDNEKIADKMVHGHEPLNLLKDAFGKNYPVVSVKRNKYERFISLYKHIIDECESKGEPKFADLLKNLTTEEILSIDNRKLLSSRFFDQVVDKFIQKYSNYIISKKEYIQIMITILYRPYSHWHGNDPNIIWFDISELKKLEDWVKDITGRDFVLEKINSSQHFECNLKLDKDFIRNFEYTFGMYEFQKSEKSLV